MKQPSSTDFWLVLSARLYEILILILPKGFRGNYAAEMSLVFRDCCRDAYLRKGFRGILGEFKNGVCDLIVSALKERISAWFSNVSFPFFLATVILATAGGMYAAFANLHNSANENALSLVLAFGFALGFFFPRGAWLSGLLIGLMMPAIHFIAYLRGWEIDYPTDIFTPLWAFLTLIPSLLSSFVGAGFCLGLKYFWKHIN